MENDDEDTKDTQVEKDSSAAPSDKSKEDNSMDATSDDATPSDDTSTNKEENGDVQKKEEEKTTEDNEGVKILMEVFGKDQPASKEAVQSEKVDTEKKKDGATE